MNTIISIKNEDADGSYLSKKALEIQKKIAKIEKLKKQQESVDEKLELLRKLYLIYSKKTKDSLSVYKEEYIVKMYERYYQKSFSNNQKQHIVDLIFNAVQELSQEGYTSETIKKIQTELQEMSVAEMDDDERAFQSEMAREYMKSMGFDVADDFDIEDITNEEFFEKQFQNFQKNHFQEEKEFNESQQKERVETTDKDFAKLYKRLAKKCHPDLTTDPDEKLRRTHMMKQLSQAWKDRNYLQLLLLKNEIDTDDDAFEINESQAKPLIKSLNKEIESLETAIYVTKNIDPESSFYFKNFGMGSSKTMTKRIKEYNFLLEREVANIKEEIAQLKTQKSTKDYLNTIVEEEMDFDFLDDFFFE